MIYVLYNLQEKLYYLLFIVKTIMLMAIGCSKMFNYEQ